MTVTRAAAFPAIVLTIHAQQGETLICLFREEAERLAVIEARLGGTGLAPSIGALRAVAQDVEDALNAMFPERAAFVEDHG